MTSSPASTMALTLREASHEDLPAVLQLYEHLADVGEEVLSPESAKLMFDRITALPGHHIYVALDGEKLVGTLTLYLIDTLAHAGARIAVVEDVVVNPACQGKGYGQQMMARVIELAREAKCYKLMLSSASHRTDAHRFYEKLGFERHGVSFIIHFE